MLVSLQHVKHLYTVSLEVCYSHLKAKRFDVLNEGPWSGNGS